MCLEFNSYSVINARSARTVCERSSVRIPVRPCSSPSPVTFGGSVWVRARTASSKGTISPRCYLHGSEQIRGRVYLSRGDIVTGRSSGSSARMVWNAPGFESRSGHVLFPPL